MIRDFKARDRRDLQGCSNGLRKAIKPATRSGETQLQLKLLQQIALCKVD
jgi:hypothetical protein